MSKHTDRFPAAPSTDAFASNTTALWHERITSGIEYQTGPRAGQQLAAFRKRCAEIVAGRVS